MSTEPAVLSVQSLLRPKLIRLIEYVNDQHEILASVYFSGLAVQLNQSRSESDLLAFCTELSRAAFVGIEYDERSWAMTDEILADAERISMTFAVNTDDPQ